MGKVEGVAIGFEDTALAALLDRDTGDIGPKLVAVGIVVERDLEGVGHGGRWTRRG